MAGLRVIGGVARGRRLRQVRGATTRPITDRVKESLFNILGADVEGSRFLDLFAGTGSVGIEALSRGAQSAVFVDSSAEAVRTVRWNLEATGLSGKAVAHQREAFAFLGDGPAHPFDYIYVAPPQYHRIWLAALRHLDGDRRWLSADGWVVVQIDPREHEDEALTSLKCFDERTYGRTQLRFYRAPWDEPAAA